MFERFTDQARRVVVFAQDEARMLDHDYIGTEHILLGLIHERDGVAAQALETFGLSLEPVRTKVLELVPRGNGVPNGHVPFTPRAKNVLELGFHEALPLHHEHVGTEHLLLGLIREGEGIGAQVLVQLGGDLNRVREQVLKMITSDPESAVQASTHSRLRDGAENQIDTIEERLARLEERVGGPDTSHLDEQLKLIRRERQIAADVQDYERAAGLRDRENELLAERATLRDEWAADRPGLEALAQRCQELSRRIDELETLLRRHGISPDEASA